MRRPWYDLPEGDDVSEETAAEARAEVCKNLRLWVESTESLPSMADRRDNVRLCFKVYSNRDEPGLDFDSAGGSILDGFTYNQQPELRALIDSQHSIVGKNRPKATMLTEGGDWEQQHTAKLVDDVLWHEFIRTQFHQKTSQMALYALVVGHGMLHFYIDWKRKCVSVEHVLISEITVDERTVAPGELPPMIARSRHVSKEALIARFPEYKEKIMESTSVLPFPGETELDETAGMVAITEGWHLPPAPGEKGHYALVTSHCTLVFEPYMDDFYPLLEFRWKNPLTGWYGIGLVQEEFGAQAELDFLDDRISESINKCAVPRVICPGGLEVDPNVITNEVGAIVQVSGQGAPIFQVGTALSPEVYEYRREVAEGMQRRSGTGAMAVDGTPPNQVEAARAMREMADSQQQRLSSPSQRFEDAHIKGAWIFLHLNKELRTHIPDDENETEFESDGMADAIDWNEFELDPNKMQLEIEASSRLSMSPSSRLSSAIELKQYGVNVPDGVFLRLLNLPDIKEETKRITAPVEHTEWTIGNLLKEIYTPPNPTLLAAHGPDVFDRVLNASLDAEMRGAPEEVLSLFRQWMTDATELMKRPAPPPPEMPPGAPPGLPPEMAGLPPGPPGLPPGLPPGIPEGGGAPPVAA